MFLYKVHPKELATKGGVNGVRYNIVKQAVKESFMQQVQTVFSEYGAKNYRGKEIIALVGDAVNAEALLTYKGYKNVLVVTSFEDSHYAEGLTNGSFIPYRSAGHHMLPVINHFNKSSANITVTRVKSAPSIYSTLYDSLGIDSVDLDEYFHLDIPFKIKNNGDRKYDAVVLLGNEGALKSGKFNVANVKKKFDKYCVDDWQLIDIYRGEKRELRGNSKNILDLRHMYKSMVSKQPINMREALYQRGADNLDWNAYIKVY